MAGMFARSWEITKLSFNVIKQDKELLLFPILAGIFSLLFIFAMLFPTIIWALIKGAGVDAYGLLEYALIFLTYLGLAFIATFFNVCVVYTAKTRFEGGDSRFGEAIRFAFSRIHLILLWSLVSASVGLLLRILDRIAEKMGKIGEIVMKIINAILGMIWSIITIFVVPSMVYKGLGPFAAIKDSINTLKKTWGESLIRYYGLGLAQLIFILAGIIVFIPLLILGMTLGAGGVITAIVLVLMYILLVILVFSVANSIFNTALYVYANTGQVPPGYSQEIMANAFRKKESRIL